MAKRLHFHKKYLDLWVTTTSNTFFFTTICFANIQGSYAKVNSLV